MQLIPQASFPHQDKHQVIDLIKRKHATGKLSDMGKQFIQASTAINDMKIAPPLPVIDSPKK